MNSVRLTVVPKADLGKWEGGICLCLWGWKIIEFLGRRYGKLLFIAGNMVALLKYLINDTLLNIRAMFFFSSYI